MTDSGKTLKKIRFIVNAFSGTSSKSGIGEKIKTCLDHSKYEYDIHFTEYPSHATKLSRESVKNQYFMVVATGGDGTVNEVAKEIVNSDTVLGVLPGGSGNGFAMHLGMGRNIAKAIRKLNSGEVIDIDTCKINENFFINIAGAGFDAWVAYQKSKSNKRGLAMYAAGVIKEAMTYKAQDYKIKVDGQDIEGKFLTIAVANGTMYGCNFTIAPKAELRDGLFDLIMIKHAPKWRQFLSSLRFINKSIHKSKICVFKKARHIEISCQDKIPYHYDGEGFYNNGPLRFTMYPLSLKVMIPGKKIIT